MSDSDQLMPASRGRSYTLEEWSALRRIGRTSAFKEVSSGRLKTYKVGTRRFVTEEADAQWLHDREAEAEASV